MPGEVTRPVRAARKGCATAPSLRSLRSTNARTSLSIASAVHGQTAAWSPSLRHHRGIAPRPVEGRAVDRGGDRKRRAGVCGAQRPQARRGGAALARGPDRPPDFARHFRRAPSARQAGKPCASRRSGVLKRREHVHVTALAAAAGIGTLYTQSLYRTGTTDSWTHPEAGGPAGGGHLSAPKEKMDAGFWGGRGR